MARKVLMSRSGARCFQCLVCYPLTHLCLASRKKALANSVDPDETPHNAASHQGLRCLLKGISVRNILNIEINILDIPNFGNKLIQFRRMGESTRHKWVNTMNKQKYTKTA